MGGDAVVNTRVLMGEAWRDLAQNEDAAQLIAARSSFVWVDIAASPQVASTALRPFTDRCPQLHGVDPARATKGGEYPPRYPPKAKAFRETIFARGYWLKASHSEYEITAQEIHILAGESFAITLRYPSQVWDVRDTQDAGPTGSKEPGVELTDLESDVLALRERLGRDKVLASAGAIDCFGLEVAVTVLDRVMDSTFDSLNAIRQTVDDLEVMVLPQGESRRREGPPTTEVARRTLYVRRLLRQVRWAFLPADEVSELRSGPFLRLSDDGIRFQLQDLCREADRAVETVSDVMQQVQQVGDLIATLKAEKLDRTTTALTVVATVLLVPTLLAGVWGMNFRRIPASGVNGGFWFALVALTAVALIVAVGIRWYLRDRATSSRRPKL
jgi:hypothetical protein